MAWPNDSGVSRHWHCNDIIPQIMMTKHLKLDHLCDEFNVMINVICLCGQHFNIEKLCIVIWYCIQRSWYICIKFKVSVEVSGTLYL